MKKFTKLFLSCAAIAAVTAAVATSAMADEVKVSGDVQGTYDAGVLNVTNVPAGEATILVLKPGADDTAVKEEDILLVDQKAAADAAFGHMGLLGAPDETAIVGAKVKIGYYADGTFKIMSGTIGAEAKKIVIGDADLSGAVDATDFIRYANYAASYKDEASIGKIGTEYVMASDSSKKVVVGDADLSGAVDATDFIRYANYAASYKDEASIGKIGQEIEVVE